MEESKSIEVTVRISHDEEVSVTKKQCVKIPNYFRIGNNTINKNKIRSINLVKESNASTAKGKWLIEKIMDSIGWDNSYSPVVKILASELTSKEKSYLEKGYAELVRRNLVRRVKQSHYMLNPDALIPLDYASAKIIWNSSIPKLHSQIPTLTHTENPDSC